MKSVVISPLSLIVAKAPSQPGEETVQLAVTLAGKHIAAQCCVIQWWSKDRKQKYRVWGEQGRAWAC